MQNATKLYACFDVYYDYCNEYKELSWITDDKEQAKYWVASFDDSDTEWRTFSEYELNDRSIYL